MESAFTFNYTDEKGTYYVTGIFSEVQSPIPGMEMLSVSFHALKAEEMRLPEQKNILIFRKRDGAEIGYMNNGRAEMNSDSFSLQLKDFVISEYEKLL